jgi:peptidoglycan-associated lipoprotein
MKRIGLLLLAFSNLGFGQGTQPPAAQQQPQGQTIVRGGVTVSNKPSPDDMYCSGFISTEGISQNHYVVGGWNSPDQVHYAGATDRVYVHGTGFKEGDKLQIVRKVRDPNRYEPFPGQSGAVRQLGQVYFERGYVRVVDVQKNVAVAIPELSCGDIVPGDLAIPLVEREAPVFRNVSLDRFAAPNGKTTGRIVMANEFDTVVGSKQKVYLSMGDDKGLKVGDYLRATRTYEYSYRDREAGLSARAKDMEETQKDPPKPGKDQFNEFPRRTVGDMIILHVHPRSATAMIMTALEDVRVGDSVELMDVSNAPEASTSTTTASPGATPSTAAAPSPPTIVCSPTPASVRSGESATISCNATSPDNHPVRVQFSTSAGKLASSGNRATLDTAQAGAGPIQVRAVATDDRDLSASTTATVNVEPAALAPATVQKATDLQFTPASARVDNTSKAVLDDVALKLRQDPGATVVLTGGAEGSEPSRLGLERAEKARDYLIAKGIDAARIKVTSGSQKSRTVEIWIVPVGAKMPQ